MWNALLCTASGHCFTWGFGGGGRLGHNSTESCLRPKMLVIADVHRRPTFGHRRRLSVQSQTAIDVDTMMNIRRGLEITNRGGEAQGGDKSPPTEPPARPRARRRATNTLGVQDVAIVHAAVATHQAGEQARRGHRGGQGSDETRGDTPAWSDMQLVRMVACGGAHTAILTVTALGVALWVSNRLTRWCFYSKIKTCGRVERAPSDSSGTATQGTGIVQNL